jgi:predicted transposase/invertase (TIGR01784 family)
MLGIAADSMSEFRITNPEMPPEAVGDKFCRLDVNMAVDGARVNLEVQVADEGDYPERSLFNWARVYSSALQAGGSYASLPRVVVISIVDFRLFGCAGYRSEFRPLEVTRREPLSDRMELLFFEVGKLPPDIDAANELELLLSLFRAKTEEDLKRLEALEVPIVTQAIGAYRKVTVSDEFKELERLRELARHNEASALARVRRETEQAVTAKVTAKWQGVVADKDAALAHKDAALAHKDVEIARLRAQLEKGK